MVRLPATVLLPSAMFGVKLYDVYCFNSVLHSTCMLLTPNSKMRWWVRANRNTPTCRSFLLWKTPVFIMHIDHHSTHPEQSFCLRRHFDFCPIQNAHLEWQKVLRETDAQWKKLLETWHSTTSYISIILRRHCLMILDSLYSSLGEHFVLCTNNERQIATLKCDYTTHKNADDIRYNIH